MTEDEAKQLFKEADTDNSGTVEYSEWVQATVDKKKIINEKNLKNAFDAFDDNGDGHITIDELKKILGQGKKIDENVWDEIMKEADENNDGEIDFQEFKNMMNKFLQ